MTDELLPLLEKARDLLLERRHGNSARSPGHNARLAIEAAIALFDKPSSQPLMGDREEIAHERLTGQEIRRGVMAALRARHFGWTCDAPAGSLAA